jgi:alkylation response protein AidB-like acyl-CoA dehydrogenase
MDLDFTEEQLMLRDSAARLCDEHCDSATVRAMEKDERGYSEAFWQSLAQTGLCGLGIAECYGGVGLGSQEQVILHQEMGRTLASAPHLESCLIAASLLQDAGGDAQRSAHLGAIATGERILIPAWQETGASADISSTGARISRDGVLQAEKVLVPFANCADAFLVPALDEDGALQVALVCADAASLRRQANHADQNVHAVSFDAVEVGPESLLESRDIAESWDRALLKAQLAIAAQAVGGAGAMLEMANEYAKQRQQFGQPIGAFQSIAHYLADRATEIEGARYLTYQAAWACDVGEDWEQLALMAKMQATAVFRRAAVTGVQIHGGMGFSSEADPQLYYRRAKHLQLMQWDPRYLERRIAAEVFA